MDRSKNEVPSAARCGKRAGDVGARARSAASQPNQSATALAKMRITDVKTSDVLGMDTQFVASVYASAIPTKASKPTNVERMAQAVAKLTVSKKIEYRMP